MQFSRPLTKAVLKKMFLKVLHEHKRPGGRYAGYAWGYEAIIRNKVAVYYEIDSLNRDEIAEGLRAVYELEKDGYIMQDSEQSNRFKILTDKGRRIVEEAIEKMQFPSVDIDQILTRSDLRGKVHADYVAGDYESAIFKAFKLLEESVRSKTKLTPDDHGAALMSKAFSPKEGILKHPDVHTEGEAQALHHLMRGSIMWFKNPRSHRTVKCDNAEKAAQVLGFANLLLNMVDECYFAAEDQGN